jgi:hypothetical protein
MSNSTVETHKKTVEPLGGRTTQLKNVDDVAKNEAGHMHWNCHGRTAQLASEQSQM